MVSVVDCGPTGCGFESHRELATLALIEKSRASCTGGRFPPIVSFIR